jgi:hypothetical protein
METVTLAAGWIGTLSGLGSDIKWLIFNLGIPIMCGAAVLVAGWKSKAPGPTLITAVFAAALWGLSANMDALSGKAVEDIEHYDKAPTTIQGDL